MKSMFDYVSLDEMKADSGNARFFDDVAEGLHDRTVYDFIKENIHDLHPFLLTGLLESLDGHDLGLIEKCTDWFEIKVLKGRMLDGRKERAKVKNITHRLNYPIEEVLDDYVNHRAGKMREARRQLKKRFDGLDHAMQEKVMMAVMEHGIESDREFIYGKLYGEDFWVDEYIPLVQKWWEQFQEGKMAKVVVKYCPREYIIRHVDELAERCNHATFCLRTGYSPDPERLPAWTYLYVKKTVGGQMQFHEGEKTVLTWVRKYLYEEAGDKPVCSLYEIPYVRRMLAYLGEMGMVEDIIALDEFDKRMRAVPRTEWGSAVIKEIESMFCLPPFVYDVVK